MIEPKELIRRIEEQNQFLKAYSSKDGIIKSECEYQTRDKNNLICGYAGECPAKKESLCIWQ